MMSTTIELLRTKKIRIDEPSVVIKISGPVSATDFNKDGFKEI